MLLSILIYKIKSRVACMPNNFYLLLICTFFCGFANFAAGLPVNQDAIQVNYHLMTGHDFQEIVVGNTVLGVTRHSHSLYMVFFEAEGTCELWKQNQVYQGHWWIEKDEQNRDFIRAYWPQYNSFDPKSIFYPDNPDYGSATAVWYYVDPSCPDTLLLAKKSFRAPITLVPGRAFPKHIPDQS